MIVAKKSYNSQYVYDNYAVDYRRYEQNTDTNEKPDKTPGVSKKKKVKNKLKIISMVFLMFCIGTLIISRYAFIMNLNNQCKNIKESIAKNQKVGENLRLELLKYYDIKQIEKDATTELGMVRPKNINIVYLSFDEQDKNDKAVETAGQSNKIGLLDKIMNFLISIRGGIIFG